MKPNQVIPLCKQVSCLGYTDNNAFSPLYLCGGKLHELWEFPHAAEKINMVLSKRRHPKAYRVQAMHWQRSGANVAVTLSSGRRRHYYLTYEAMQALYKYGLPCWVRLEV